MTAMKVGWQFERGETAVGEVVPIKCRFIVSDQEGSASTTVEFVISEEAAQELAAVLVEAAKPPSDITVVSSMEDLKGTT
jgi:hypothetical protein